MAEDGPMLGKERRGLGELVWEACCGKILGPPRLEECRQHPEEMGDIHCLEVKVDDQDTGDLSRRLGSLLLGFTWSKEEPVRGISVGNSQSAPRSLPTVPQGFS